MYVILNVLVFLLLTGYAFVLMVSKPSYVKLSKTEKVLLTGREKFLLLTLVTGMVGVLGLNLSVLRLMIWIFMILLAFVLYRKSPKFNIIILVYMLFLGFMTISLIWTEDIGFGIRVILKYLYPFLIMLFAFTFVHSREFIFVAMRWLVISAFLYSIFLGGIMTHVLGIWFFYLDGVFMHMAALNDYLGIISGISYLMWWRTKDKKYLYLIGWFLLSAILQSTRTGVLAIFVVFSVASYLRYRAYSVPYLVGIVMISIFSVIFVPQLNEKMFYEAENISSVDSLGEVSTSQINSNGRFAMWEWSLNEYYEDNKLTGAGAGTIQERFYSGNHPFGKIKIIHNDYVQMLCDIGLTGLLLYVFFVLYAIRIALRRSKKKIPNYLKNTSFLVITSFTATLITMMTDNVVNYTFAVHSYPFIFLGIMMAYRNIHKKDLKMGNGMKTL